MKQNEKGQIKTNTGAIVGVIVAAMLITSVGCWYISMLGQEQDVATAELSRAATSIPTIAVGERNPATPATQDGAADGEDEPAADAAVAMKTFHNDEAGYTFQFPASMAVNSPDRTSLHPFAYTSPLGTMHEAYRGRTEPIKTNLEKGRLTKDHGFAVKASHKLVRLNDGTYAQQYITLRELDACNVQFTATLEFYRNDYQVMIGMSGPEAKFSKLLPDYIGNNAMCPGALSWNDQGMEEFYAALVADEAPVQVQAWYEAFKAMVKTVRVN